MWANEKNKKKEWEEEQEEEVRQEWDWRKPYFLLHLQKNGTCPYYFLVVSLCDDNHDKLYSERLIVLHVIKN